MSSPAVTSFRFCLLLFAGAALLSSLTAAESAILVPIEGLPHPDTYDTFLVAEDAFGLSSPRLGVVPKMLEFETDPVSRRPKFGVQYEFSPGSPAFASLTASLRYHQDPAEIKEIMTAAEAKLGMSSGTIQLSSLNPFSSRLSFFLKSDDNSIKMQSLSPSSGSLTASYPVVVDLSTLSKSRLRGLLGGASAVGGFAAQTESNSSIYERKNDAGDWEAIINWMKSFPALSIRMLAFPNNELAKSRLDIRLAIAVALGAPSIVSSGGVYILGWDMTAPEVAAKLTKALSDARSSGPLAKVAEKYENGTVMPLENVCASLVAQILDLSTGTPGCAGLQQ
jgi:hypothetical protein